jgi:hypothetical protein
VQGLLTLRFFCIFAGEVYYTQNAQNYVNRNATQCLTPAGFCVLTALNALHFSEFCVK